MVARADAEVMDGRCIDVQLRRDASFLQRKVHQHTVLRRADDIVSSVREEDRRRADWDA